MINNHLFLLKNFLSFLSDTNNFEDLIISNFFIALVGELIVVITVEIGFGLFIFWQLYIIQNVSSRLNLILLSNLISLKTFKFCNTDTVPLFLELSIFRTLLLLLFSSVL